MRRRTLLGAAGLAALAAPVLAGAPAFAGTGGFTTATATRDTAGAYRLAWACGAARVTVTATTDPYATTGVAVGSGAGTGTLDVPAGALPAATRWYFRLVADGGDALVVADRSLGFASARNFRDLGGYRTTDGHWVRTGLAYRSNTLASLTDGEQAALTALGITRDVDLRNVRERHDDPDRIPPGVTYQVADVEDLTRGVGFHDGAVLTLVEAVALGLLGGTGNLGQRVAYPFLVDFTGADRAYRGLLTALASEPGATVFHCSSGKDRTGWGSAVLLSLLGVPRATVEADYLASNTYLGNPTAVELSWLRAAFDEADSLYGSVDGYLRQGLALDDATIGALRTKFLA